MIKFIEEIPEEVKKPTLGMVEEDQFFISISGYLCQKYEGHSYVTIANRHGDPELYIYHDVEYDLEIQKILPKITKIEF